MNEEIIGFDALYESMTKCIKGVRWKDSVAHYHLNAIEETLKLEKELHEGTYKPRKPKEFTIYAPKRRDILSVSFRDRPAYKDWEGASTDFSCKCKKMSESGWQDYSGWLKMGKFHWSMWRGTISAGEITRQKVTHGSYCAEWTVTIMH